MPFHAGDAGLIYTAATGQRGLTLAAMTISTSKQVRVRRFLVIMKTVFPLDNYRSSHPSPLLSRLAPFNGQPKFCRSRYRH